MAKDHDVIIYLRSILLEVVIPEQYVWDFMKEFGSAFAEDYFEGGRQLKPVERYYAHHAGWHIVVSVPESKEKKFYGFLRVFCKKHKLTFRKPKK